jgi:NAD(P)-dependent dehydrogenase (short-subunit alcohol dehydrogenase family)
VTTRVALVTASSKGIGAAIARELAGRGYGVALLARGEEVHALADELDGISLRGTVDDDGSLAALIAAAMGRWGRIDACVANTGHPPKGSVLALTDAQWREGYALILESVFRLARRVAPIFAAQRSGAFVAISSYAAARPDVARPVSSVFRAGLSAYVKLLAEELAPHGARANAVLPGFIDSQPVHPATIATIPLGRSGTMGELAKTVAWLASEEAAFVTGQSLLVDGGMVRSL